MGNWKFRSNFYHWFRRVYPINRIYFQEIQNIQKLLDQVSNHPTCIMDLGTGIGESLSFIPKGTIRVILDHSFFMLKKIPSSIGNHKVIGDILKLPIKIEKFDLITCIGVSEYIRSKSVLLHEIYQSLKPGGFALASNHTRSSSVLRDRRHTGNYG